MLVPYMHLYTVPQIDRHVLWTQAIIFTLVCTKWRLTAVEYKWLSIMSCSTAKCNRLFICGEKPERRILPYKSKEPTAGCMAVFHEYRCNMKHGGIITNLTLRKPWGCCLYVKTPCCGCMEHVLKYITFYVKIHLASLAVSSGFPLVHDGPIRASSFVRSANCIRVRNAL